MPNMKISDDASVSGLNATDKTPMYEMPLNYVYGILGLGRTFFALGFSAMAFCPEIIMPPTSSLDDLNMKSLESTKTP